MGKVQVHRSFATQKSMPCPKVMSLLCSCPPSQHCLCLAWAIIIPGEEAPSWHSCFVWIQIPSSELKLRQPDCSNSLFFFFPSFLIISLNDSTLLNNWQTCTNCTPGMVPSACSTQRLEISDPNAAIGQIVCNKITKHL